MKDRILMLWPNKKDYWPKQIEKRRIVDIDDAFYNHGLAYGAVRKIFASHGIFLDVFLGNWKKKIDSYDVIIVQASKITAYIPDFLRKKNFKGRVIYWYWDPVSRCVSPERMNREVCELWSFDYRDCQKYNMRFNDTYYVFDSASAEKCEIKWDIVFIGRDKGRLEQLNKLKEKFEKNDLRTLFYIVPTKPYSLNARRLKKVITYEEILEIVKKSRCLVDINQSNQSGLSQRCMESLYFNKKILSDNHNICKYKLYHKKMIIPLSDMEKIKSFIMDEDEYDAWQLKYYTFENWLDRFGLKK